MAWRSTETARRERYTHSPPLNTDVNTPSAADEYFEAIVPKKGPYKVRAHANDSLRSNPQRRFATPPPASKRSSS